jgi:hypothetical protein
MTLPEVAEGSDALGDFGEKVGLLPDEVCVRDVAADGVRGLLPSSAHGPK